MRRGTASSLTAGGFAHATAPNDGGGTVGAGFVIDEVLSSLGLLREIGEGRARVGSVYGKCDNHQQWVKLGGQPRCKSRGDGEDLGTRERGMPGGGGSRRANGNGGDRRDDLPRTHSTRVGRGHSSSAA